MLITLLFKFLAVGYQELCGEVAPLSLVEHLVEFEQGPVLFYHNSSTQKATFPKILNFMAIKWSNK